MPAVAPKEELEDVTGVEEVKFSAAMWGGDYKFAFETARHLAEQATTPELAGYRGWWWYLASVAARLAAFNSAEIDCLWHSSKSGIQKEKEFAAEVEAAPLDFESVKKLLTKTRLK
jgi:hypothetical protein